MKFNLNTGKPAAYQSGRLSAHSEEAVEVKRVRPFIPANEPDTILKCGCAIPWPVIQLIGSRSRTGAPQIQCDIHGWQHVADTEIKAAKKRGKDAQKCATPNQSILPDTPPF